MTKNKKWDERSTNISVKKTAGPMRPTIFVWLGILLIRITKMCFVLWQVIKREEFFAFLTRRQCTNH